MEANNSSNTMDELAKRLSANRSGFFVQPFSFSWWLHGGEPGSPSDYLSLEGDRGSVRGTYIRVRFDPRRHPPEHSEKFEGTIDLNRAAAVLQQVFEGPLFRQQFKEESDRGMRDLQKETWVFRRGSAQYEKTLFTPLPESLAGSRSQLHELTEQLSRAVAR